MTFDALLTAVSGHGTAILLPLSILEGPIVTVLAGYAARLGVLQVAVAFVVVVLGDLVGDSVLYLIGRKGLRRIPARWLARLGLVPDRVAALSAHYAEKGGRTLILGKITHSAGAAVLVAAGLARMPFPAFLWFNLLGTLPKSAAFLALGYLLGEAATHLGPTIAEGSMVMLAVLILAALAWWLWPRRRAE